MVLELGNRVEVVRVLRYTLKKKKKKKHKSQDIYKGTFKGDFDKDSERKEESWREKLQLLRQYTNIYKQNTGRNIDCRQ